MVVEEWEGWKIVDVDFELFAVVWSVKMTQMQDVHGILRNLVGGYLQRPLLSEVSN